MVARSILHPAEGVGEEEEEALVVERSFSATMLMVIGRDANSFCCLIDEANGCSEGQNAVS